MEELFKRILDKLTGADFWIALGFLAAGLTWWRWIGTTKTQQKKVLRSQICIALVLMLLAGGAMFLNHFFFLREPVFSKNVTGILVMRIVGDDALDSLQGTLIETLNSKLKKEATGQQIEVHASSEILNENNGLEVAHERARAIGRRHNAKLVVWGRRIGDNKFFPRITVMAPPKDWNAESERTHDAQDITEFHLPDELVDEPFYLIHFAAGYSYFVQNKYEEALAHFKAAQEPQGALASPSELADLQFFTAFCLCQDADQESMAANLKEAIGLYEKAARVYKKADQRKWGRIQNNLGALYGLLVSEDRAANTQKAIADLNEAIRVDPKSPKAYYNRGSVYLDKGDYDKALADLNEAIRLDPKSPKAYYNRGAAYKAKQDYDKALADFGEAIDLNPKFAVNYFGRGNVYQSKGDYDKALADFDEAIRLDPKLVIAYFNRGNIYQGKGDYDKALANFEEAIDLNPKSARAYYSRGDTYQAMGQDDKAIIDYDEAIRLDPKLAFVYNNRGNAYQTKGDYDKAIIDYDEAIRLDPKLALACYDRGNAYLTKGDYDKAIIDYGEAIRLDPKLALAYYNRGNAYQARRDYEKAIADYDEGIRLDPKLASAYNSYAWLLGTCPQASFRDGKKAVEYATKACELSEWKDPILVDTLAAAYAGVGDFEHAIKWETKYLETPNISEIDATAGKSRLALYQAHKPYHEPRVH